VDISQNLAMCNRFVQSGQVVKPGQKCRVLMRGPAGKFEVDYSEAVFSGAARDDNRKHWEKREGAEEVQIPDVEKYGEKNKTTGVQSWETLRSKSSMQGLLLPQPQGKSYRLLKVVTTDAGPKRTARLGNDRTPIFEPPLPDEPGPIEAEIPARAVKPPNPSEAQGELF
jgi:hypothetical protein